MTAIQQAEELLTKMSAGEKVQILHLIAQELVNSTPGIMQSPDVCGGEPRIAGTRIPVWTLVQFRKLGVSEADLLHAFPTLNAEDLTNAWAYYKRNPDQIEQQITENEAA